MNKLIDLIRDHRRRRLGLDDDFQVVRIRYFTGESRPQIRRGGKDFLLKNMPDESFEMFEARVVAAAKAAGCRWVVITVPDSGEPIVAEPVDDDFLRKNPDQMTNAELLVIVCGGHDATDPSEITNDELKVLASRSEVVGAVAR
jgi:hypothetical protein